MIVDFFNEVGLGIFHQGKTSPVLAFVAPIVIPKENFIFNEDGSATQNALAMSEYYMNQALDKLCDDIRDMAENSVFGFVENMYINNFEFGKIIYTNINDDKNIKTKFLELHGDEAAIGFRYVPVYLDMSQCINRTMIHFAIKSIIKIILETAIMPILNALYFLVDDKFADKMGYKFLFNEDATEDDYNIYNENCNKSFEKFCIDPLLDPDMNFKILADSFPNSDGKIKQVELDHCTYVKFSYDELYLAECNHNDSRRVWTLDIIHSLSYILHTDTINEAPIQTSKNILSDWYCDNNKKAELNDNKWILKRNYNNKPLFSKVKDRKDKRTSMEIIAEILKEEEDNYGKQF